MIHPDLAIPRMFAGVSGPVINDIKKVYTLHVESTEHKSSKLTRWWKGKVGDISFAFRWKVMPKLRTIKRRLKDFGLVLRKACRRIKWFVCQTSELERCQEDLEYFADKYLVLYAYNTNEKPIKLNSAQKQMLRLIDENRRKKKDIFPVVINKDRQGIGQIKAEIRQEPAKENLPQISVKTGPQEKATQDIKETIKKPMFEFKCTCRAYPEQYDVYENSQCVAYIRMRHGNLSVNPVVSDYIDFETEIYHRTYEDKLLGVIPDNEREDTLKLIGNKITEYLASKNGSPENR